MKKRYSRGRQGAAPLLIGMAGMAAGFTMGFFGASWRDRSGRRYPPGLVSERGKAGREVGDIEKVDGL